MFLRIARVQSTKQSGIIGGKIPFDPNIIIYYCYEKYYKNKVRKDEYYGKYSAFESSGRLD